uniref:High-osmolarity-induced transcription protein 1 n=1 Tax=Talaromyces marneffei PM1 TaxID=1077442 RepID=A0A093XJK8_TALMA
MESQAQALTTSGLVQAQNQKHLRNHARLETRTIELAHQFQRQRAERTNKSYDKPQEEYREWCHEHGFADGESVTEKKLLLFLDECVVNRPIRHSRYKKARTDEQGDPVIQKLGYPSIKRYTASLVDLWKFQKTLGTVTGEPPNQNLIPKLLKSHKFCENQRKLSEYIDRGQNSLQDGYTQENIRALVRYCWTGWQQTDQKGRKPQAQESYLRTSVDFLLSHNMLLRGEDRRNLQFADLFTIYMEEGPTPCWPMIMIKHHGKTNQFGRTEYMGVMRHQEPLLCTISQAAFYLFYRWEFMQEPIPQFWQRQQWYNWHFFKGRNISAPLSRTRKTHSGRSGGAQVAELQGVDENSIRRAGHWNQDAMSNCYLAALPRDFLRTMAGFRPGDHKNYYLPRATITPPESLVRALWPWVDAWLIWFQQEDTCIKDIDPILDLPPQPPLVQAGKQQIDSNDLAAQGFLKLLQQLRIILLQDAVFLQIEMPSHSMWKHSLFQRSDFKAFAQELLQSIRTTQTPYEIQLQQSMPAIADRIINTEHSLQQTMSLNQLQLLDHLRTISSQVNDLISGQVSFTVRANGLESGLEQYTLAQDSIQPNIDQKNQPINEDSILEQSQPIPAAFSTEMPSYTLSRTIKTVRELWAEWTIGLNGQLAVQALEQQYGAKWRSESKERVMFRRRKIIIDEIYARTKDGTPVIKAVEALELIQARMKCSLAKLGDFLKESRTDPCI